MFAGRWVGLPYIYNALKTLRWEGVHDAIWRDDKVKNVHYILSPKPWDEWTKGQIVGGAPETTKDPANEWWHSLNEKRLKEEEKAGILDGF